MAEVTRWSRLRGPGRRGKPFLSPSQKYEIWLQCVSSYRVAFTCAMTGTSADGELLVAKEMAMTDAWVDLGEAIEGLRSTLTEAIERGATAGMHFRLAPVELTLEAGLTKEGSGKVGWKILEVGGSRGSSTTQTLKLSLTPVWTSSDGILVDDPLISAAMPGQSRGQELGAGRQSSAASGTPGTRVEGADEEDDE